MPNKLQPDRHLVVPIFSQHESQHLRIPRTFDNDRRVREGALLLSDEKLIAKYECY